MKSQIACFVRWWMPAIGWMLVIFTASSDFMSAEHTSRFIGPFLQWFMPQISAAGVANVQLFVRKAAHVTEYAILAALLFRGLRGGARASVSPAMLALLGAVVCAAFDEFHQSFVPSRTGTPIDVIIDAAGAATGVAIYYLLTRRSSVRVAVRERGQAAF